MTNALRPAEARRRHPKCRIRGGAGFTLIELLIVVSVLGIVFSIAAPRLRGLENELGNAAFETAGFLLRARAEAMTSTSAYRVVAESQTRLRTEFSRGCGVGEGEWSVDRGLILELRAGISFEGLEEGELVCFNSRGLADANPTVRIRERGAGASDVEVFVGGAVEVRPVEEGA